MFDATELRTIHGLSAREYRDPMIRAAIINAWLGWLNLHLTRHFGTFAMLYDLAEITRLEDEEIAAQELPQGWVRRRLSQFGRMIESDDRRLTREAAAGALLSLLWEQFSHFAYHIGFEPGDLRRGEKINGATLTELMYASRHAYQHGMNWLLRDFKIDGQGKKQIKILQKAGLVAIPFSADAAIRLIAPDGVMRLNLRLVAVAQGLATEAIAKTDRPLRKKHRKRRQAKLSSRDPRQRAI